MRGMELWWKTMPTSHYVILQPPLVKKKREKKEDGD